MRRTKIVATLGPASYDPAVIDSIIKAGTDGLRVNFAHAAGRTQNALAKLVRDGAQRSDRIVSLLADLPGPKMRTGPVNDGEVRLETGQTFELRDGPSPGDETGVATTVPQIASLLAPGDEVFLADGQIVLEVVEVQPDTVRTIVIRDGILRSGKGMRYPRCRAQAASLHAARRRGPPPSS